MHDLGPMKVSYSEIPWEQDAEMGGLGGDGKSDPA